MKRITLDRITIENFKGMQEGTLTFDSKNATISGANGSGKTTIFDAFTWLLFGKDHQGRAKFDIKPRQPNGEELHHLDTKVTAIIKADDREITLSRTYKEEWKKQRGTAEQYLAGHTEEFSVDGTPHTAKEYKKAIEELCPEDIFRAITSPRHFAEQKPEEQRKLLAQLASVLPEDITAELNKAHSTEETEAITATCATHPAEAHKKQLAAQRKECQTLIDTIPARIDELQKAAPERSNKSISLELSQRQNELQALLEGTAPTAQAEERMQLQREIQVQEQTIAETTLKAYQEEGIKLAQEQAELETQRATLQSTIDKRALIEDRIRINNEQREKLREQYKAVKAEVQELKPDDLRCPCCGRAFEPDQVEIKVQELQARFNEQKAERLTKIQAKGHQLKEEGETLALQLEDIEAAEASVNEVTAKLHSIKSQIKARTTLEETIKAAKQTDAKLNALNIALNEIPEASPTQEDEQRKQRIEQLQSDIAQLQVQRANHEAALAAEARINDLRQQLKEANQQLAAVEREEDHRKAYSLAYGRALEAKVNQHFRFVQFSLFDYTLDGTAKETCKAQVNGIAYGSTLNTAAQINAGLDIIQTLCQHYQIQAPVFVDNAESVNELIDIPSQTIQLRVNNSPLTLNTL